MVNGMIGLWSNLTMVPTRYLMERNQLECGLTIIFQVRYCFFVIPGDDTTYAIMHSCNVNDHESDSILFERWELENTSGTLKMVNGALIDIFMWWMLILLVILFWLLRIIELKIFNAMMKLK